MGDEPVGDEGGTSGMKAAFVPLGKVNIAHVEVTREIARRFNALYGEVFPVFLGASRSSFTRERSECGRRRSGRCTICRRRCVLRGCGIGYSARREGMGANILMSESISASYLVHLPSGSLRRIMWSSSGVGGMVWAQLGASLRGQPVCCWTWSMVAPGW